jgi:glycerophosphoryl diester phosphodiesterase
VAHRGASDVVAEHTLAAYIRAIDDGADGVECDVRLTRDGHLVCVHDRRVNRTSDGRGLVSTLDLAQLDGLDFGSWHTAFPDSADELVRDEQRAPERLTEHARSKVLTLSHLLEYVEAQPRPVRVLIETKHPTRYSGLVEKELATVLARFGLTSARPGGELLATMMSFSALAVRRMRDLAPAVPTVLLMEAYSPVRRDGSLPFGAVVAGPGIGMIRTHPRYVERAHAKGNEVYVWTVDEPQDVELVVSLGVDAIITNRPADVLAQVGR